MNEATAAHKLEKQGFLMWLLTAFFQKLFVWLCPPNMGLSPLAAQQFLENIGAGGTDMKGARNSESFTRAKSNVEV